MEKEKYIQDLRQIKEIMDRSSKFISLSGLSGVAAGIIALAGAWYAYRNIYTESDFYGYQVVTISSESIASIIGLGIVILVLAIGAGVFFTAKKAKKANQKVWNSQAKRLLINLSIPLVTGGLLSLISLSRGFIGIIAPLTLIFYGLALVNASKYTHEEIRSLGIIEIALGLLSAYFIGFGLLFWAIGFGLLHIVYGIIMHYRYGS
ncbi:hypothetical protein MMU07_09315 [Aquiflexum sp. LQ15W]|uniref:hypothetical protein n=1 Tax=Cognataquiflexum nitidum TaxID=2922272 RepID=UPI001F13E1A9|nr:hypothetical protein [Cognataquiflexum nitidum]MCH6199779.1 hypothetical protein [Cognataquiflexum nitidum]